MATRVQFREGWCGEVHIRVDGPVRDNDHGRRPIAEEHVDEVCFVYFDDIVCMPAADTLLADILRKG